MTHWLGFVSVEEDYLRNRRSLTFESISFFKALRIAEGDLNLLLIFASLMTIPPIFGSDFGYSEEGSFAKSLNRSIAFQTFLSTSDFPPPANRFSAMHVNALSEAINTLLISQWNGTAQITNKGTVWKNLSIVCGPCGFGQKICSERLVPWPAFRM